jgi:hypothetical protein
VAVYDERSRFVILPHDAVAGDLDASERTKCQPGKFERTAFAANGCPADVRFDGTQLLGCLCPEPFEVRRAGQCWA